MNDPVYLELSKPRELVDYPIHNNLGECLLL